MIGEIPTLDKTGLRKFGLMMASIIAVLFGLLLPWIFDLSFPLWPWIVAGVLAAWSLVAPASLNWLYIGWMRFGLLLNKITTPIIMGLVFFIVVTPMSLIMKLLGRDPMQRKLSKQVDTYRIPSRKRDISQIEKPF